LARQELKYLRTRNPVYAWRAYAIARAARTRRAARAGDESIPEWVLNYFDAVVERLERATTPAAILEAIGLHQQGGGASKREQARTYDRDQRIIADIDEARAGGLRMAAAIDEVAPAHNVSPERARSIYYSGRKLTK